MEDRFSSYSFELKKDISSLVGNLEMGDSQVISLAKKISRVEEIQAEKLSVMESQVRSFADKIGGYDLQQIDQSQKTEILQQTTREYVELIEALNEKLSLHSDQVVTTRNAVFKKLSLIEKQILDKLNIDGGGEKIHIKFQAYEDTIEKIE